MSGNPACTCGGKGHCKECSTHVVALHDYNSGNEGDLVFSAGQRIRVTNRDVSGWWQGTLAEGAGEGLFPATYVQAAERVRSVRDAVVALKTRPDRTVVSDENPDVPLTFGEKFKVYWAQEGSKVVVMVLWLATNVLLFFLTYAKYMDREEVIEQLGKWVPIARGFGSLLKFNCTLLVVPVLRNLLAWFHALPFAHYLPLHKNIVFHKWLAFWIMILAVGHTVAHLFNISNLTRQAKNDPGGLDSALTGNLEADIDNGKAKSLWYWVFTTVPGITGVALCGTMLLIYAACPKMVRRANFEVFWYSHHLFVLFWGLQLFHGAGGLLEPPSFWKWFVGPGSLYALERFVRFMRSRRDIIVSSVVKHPSGVLELRLTAPWFKYRAGQYAFLNVPLIAPGEWHPITISSAPEEAHVTFHVKQVGDWTRALPQLFNPGGGQVQRIETARDERGTRLISLDGPFGTPTEGFADFDVLMLVGAGIGVTPFASVLKHLGFNLARAPGETRLKKIRFYWIMRDRTGFEWFSEVLKELESVNKYGVLEINCYMTGALKLDEVRDVMFTDEGQGDPITGLQEPTHFGRPRWPEIFKAVAGAHKGSEVGVFFCGPKVLSRKLRVECGKATRDTRGATTFAFHKENCWVQLGVRWGLCWCFWDGAFFGRCGFGTVLCRCALTSALLELWDGALGRCFWPVWFWPGLLAGVRGCWEHCLLF
eukprot:TRINITY_DN2228_c1_g2_i1.p1 TRINITY_DN2228_c1_g2~~TRINITY_DN2228_c1_g2_i1.p1  ORF type:complete len:707 (-),score=161.82 TRINITY_DN2228_c1_g2_i1:355-2475(-)